MPRPKPAPWGRKYSQPALPIRVGRHDDHRYDAVAPRGVGPCRYRIYRLRAGELEMIAAVRTPSKMGQALVQLHENGEFIVDDSVGVLDTKEDPGHWIVHPFSLGRRRVEQEVPA